MPSSVIDGRAWLGIAVGGLRFCSVEKLLSGQSLCESYLLQVQAYLKWPTPNKILIRFKIQSNSPNGACKRWYLLYAKLKILKTTASAQLCSALLPCPFYHLHTLSLSLSVYKGRFFSLYMSRIPYIGCSHTAEQQTTLTTVVSADN